MCDGFGKYRLVLYIKDSVGKTKEITKDFNFTYSVSAPEIKITPSNGSTATLTWDFKYTPQQKVKLTSLVGRFGETGEWSVLVPPGENGTIPFSGSAVISTPNEEGTKTLNIYATTTDGQKSAEGSAVCIVDKTAPELTLFHFEQGQIYGGANDEHFITCKVYAKEKNAEAYWQEPVSTGFAGGYEDTLAFVDVTKAPFTAGSEYTLRVDIEDIAGNVTSKTMDISVPDDGTNARVIEAELEIENRKRDITGMCMVGTNQQELTLKNNVQGATWYINNDKVSAGVKNLAGNASVMVDTWNNAVATVKQDGVRKYSVSRVENGLKFPVEFTEYDIEGNVGTQTIVSMQEMVSFRIKAQPGIATYKIKTYGGQYVTIQPDTTYHVCDIDDSRISANMFDIQATALSGKNVVDTQLVFYGDPSRDEYFLYSDVENYAPANLTADDKINYKTYLKWDVPDTIPANISYEVYRSTEENFEPDDTNRIASGIKAGYFTEINTGHGKTFYYKVCAAKPYTDYSGETAYLRSSFSEEQSSRVVDQNESVKKLGMKDFWEFTEFTTPNGNGYIEKSGGNFLYEQKDAQIPNEGFDVHLTRAYNSQSSMKGTFGFGWSHDYDIELINVCENGSTAYTHMALKDGNGTIYHFTKDTGESEYVSTLGEYVSLVVSDEETTKTVALSGSSESREIKYKFLLSTKDGVYYYFNLGGQLVLMEDANGKFVVFEHDIKKGLLSKMVTNNNIAIEFTYNDGTGGTDPLTIKEITMPDGNKVQYEYTKPLFSSEQLLTKVTEISGEETISYVYEYDKPLLSSQPRNLSVIKDAQNKYQYKINYDFEEDRVSEVLYPNDEKFTFTYSPDNTCTVTKKYSGGQAVLGEKDFFERISGKCEKTIRGVTDVSRLDGTDETGLDVTNFTYHSNLLVSAQTTAQYYEINSDGYVVKKSGTKENKAAYSGDKPVKETEDDGTVSEYTYYTAEDGEHLEYQIKTQKETSAGGKVTGYRQYSYDTAGNITETIDYIAGTKINNTYYTEGAFKGELHTMSESLITVNSAYEITATYLKSTSVYGYAYSTTDGVTTKTETCTQTIPKPDGTSEVMTATTVYDVMGRMLSQTDSRGYQTINTFDGFGRVTGTTYKYSNSEQLKQQTSKSYDKNGMITYEKLADGIEKWYTYDNMGRLLTTRVKSGTDIDETINTTYRYEDIAVYQGKGNETVSIDNAYVTKQAYSDGTVISEVYEDQTGNIVRAYQNGVYMDMTYSSQGDLITKWYMGQTLSSTDGLLEIYTYDDKGNLTATITDPEYITGTNTTGYHIREDSVDDSGTSQPGSIVSKSTYDEDGNVTSHVDPRGNTTQYSYDEKANLTSVLLPDQAKYEYRYDVPGADNTTMDIVLEPRETGTAADRQMSKSIVVKDNTDKTIKVEDLGTSDSDDTSISTAYEYDIRDNLIKSTEKNGNYKSYTYDTRDRLTSTDYYEMINGSAVKTLKTEFTYDDADNLTSMTDKEVTDGEEVMYRYTAYGYDGVNRLTWVSECKTSSAPTDEAINANKVSYEYDGKDRLLSITYANSDNGVKGLNFTYNIHGWLMKVDAVNENDHEKTLREYTYANDGMVSVITDYTDFLSGTSKWLKRTYTYDKLKRVTAIEYTDNMSGNSSDVKEKYTYEYDKNNNIVSEVRQNSYGTANGADYREEYSFEYDANNRLVSNDYWKMETASIGGDHAEVTYGYDAAGNKTSEEVRIAGALRPVIFENTYTYNEFNQLTRAYEEDPDSARVNTYSYDQNGNQTSKSTVNAYTDAQISQTSYTYDAANRLKTATETTDQTVAYTQENQYNGFGQRIQKKEGSDVTNYFYDGTAVLYTTDDSDTVTSFNLIGAEDNILSTSRTGADGASDFYVYTKDIRESTTNIIGKDGTAQVSYTYDEYGETTEHQKDAENPFYNEICYTAGVYDDTTKLYYLNARYYSPEAGTFLTQDTYRGSRSRTSTLNYYAYCAGNPISYTDPTGHWVQAVLALGWLTLGAVDGYKYAKKKGYKGKKKKAAIVVGAVTGIVPISKATKIAKVGKALKFTPKANNVVKVSKTVKHVMAQPKIATTLNQAGQAAMKKALAKKTNQTVLKSTPKKIGPVCFVAGTKIHTDKGFKDIEHIKPGDYVWSENPETHEKALKKVKKIFVREKDSIIRLSINGEVIETTDEHPFYVEGRGFTEAQNLKAGEEVRTADGSIATVDSIESIRLDEPIKVYNFEVKDFHTYYVSEQKVLVHNTCAKVSKYWSIFKEVGGKKVYQRDDLIDINKIDKDGLTNLQRMKNGKAPLGPDDQPINLHHMIQTEDSAIAEITQSMHQRYKKTIHINPNSMPSAIYRPKFKRWREEYWKNRVKDFEG